MNPSRQSKRRDAVSSLKQGPFRLVTTHLPVVSTELGSTVVVGAVTFAAVCAVSCALQKSLLDAAWHPSFLSTTAAASLYLYRTRLLQAVSIPSGVATVVLGSVASQTSAQCLVPWFQTQIRAQHWKWGRSQRSKQPKRSSNRWNSWSLPLDLLSIPDAHVQRPNLVKLGTVGLLSFLLLCRIGSGSSHTVWRDFGRVAPSSYIHVGSFGRSSVAATERYATVTQRARLAAWGRRQGCHTCGYSDGGHGRAVWQAVMRRFMYPPGTVPSHAFVGDHQPPKSIAAILQGHDVVFRMYPQCVKCSQTQGSLLSASKRAAGVQRSYLKFHLRPRWFHLTGSVAALTPLRSKVARNRHVRPTGPLQSQWIRPLSF